ncbi:MAG: ATP-grasp fold amidoligase family protein [Gemmatimonadota bacterium]
MKPLPKIPAGIDLALMVAGVFFRIYHWTNIRVFHTVPNYLLFFYVHRQFPRRGRLNVKHLAFFQKHDQSCIALGPFVDKETAKIFARSLAPEVGIAELYEVIRTREGLVALNLDRPYVAKPAHGSGVVVRKPRGGPLTPGELEEMERELNYNYYKAGGELQYRFLEKKIIVEEFLGQPPDVPWDYKVHCYRGHFLYCTVIMDRFGNSRNQKLDRDGKLLPLGFSSPWGDNPAGPDDPPLDAPDNWEDVVAAAEKLSALFEYVRVDLFSAGDKVYFGEWTFSPGNCLFRTMPDGASEVETWLGPVPAGQ